MLREGATLEQSASIDREALARILHAYRDQIKEGFRARFASGSLAFYDSSDFFATVLRRADQLTSRLDRVASHEVRRMLREIVLEALSDCARSARSERRLRRVLRRPGRAEQPQNGDGAPNEREVLDRLRLSADELDLARLRASGMKHSKVAEALGVSAAAIRMRWVRLVDKARANGAGAL